MRGRQEGRPAGGLHRPRGRQGSVHVPRPRSGRRESARAQGVSRGQRLLPTCFSLRRSRAQAGPQGQKRGRSPARAANARATLSERRGRSRAAAARVGKSLWLSYASAGPAGDAPARPPGDGEAGSETARPCPRSQPGARGAWGRGSRSPAAGGRTAPPPSPPPWHGLGAARAAPLEMSPAPRALQGLHPGMLPAPRPRHSALPRATRTSAGSAGAPAAWDARAIVLDPRPSRL